MKLKSADEIFNILTQSITDQLNLKYEDIGFYKHITNKVFIAEKKGNLSTPLKTKEDLRKNIFYKNNIDSFLTKYSFNQFIENDSLNISIVENDSDEPVFDFILSPTVFNIMEDYPLYVKPLNEILKNNNISQSDKIYYTTKFLEFSLDEFLKFLVYNS